jgi:RNA polymerase sigma-70 factor, ECF subfamily
VRSVEPARPTVEAPARDAGLDPEARRWLAALRGADPGRAEALGRLHALLLRAARFELSRRRSALRERSERLEELALQSADDALVAVLAKLDEYRGDSRFETWAYKFGIYEAAVKARRRAWEGRELPLTGAESMPNGRTPPESAESGELLRAVVSAMDEVLSVRQREVLTALALNGVPIDVLAERLGTTRGALYKTVHDARAKLRGRLAERGFDLGGGGGWTR